MASGKVPVRIAPVIQRKSLLAPCESSVAVPSLRLALILFVSTLFQLLNFVFQKVKV